VDRRVPPSLAPVDHSKALARLTPLCYITFRVEHFFLPPSFFLPLRSLSFAAATSGDLVVRPAKLPFLSVNLFPNIYSSPLFY
jgi:hypothetical protein